ncbi:MAG TPA: MgtC/SapB family protein [Caulobacterales bacterium]|jgi:putative Mg2+ transporter-C (MgtC) family protein|nr:MgtC/SapB family protein [Caulobacterales bacterium]
MMTGFADYALRLAAATAIGCLLGLTRDVAGKPAGMRTMGLVAFGSALITLCALDAGARLGAAGLSRLLQGVIQGVLTGVGFVGAGAVLHSPEGTKVRGLTTAAIIWAAAMLGVACGLGAWANVALASGLALVLIVVLHPLEKHIEDRARRAKEDRKTTP